MPYWYIFRSDALLLTADDSLPHADRIPVTPATGSMALPLPSIDGRKAFAVRVADDSQPLPGMRYVGLRQTFDLLSRPHYVMAGKARELLHWDAQSRYCGICGAPMTQHTDISKRCTACGHEVWPAVSPAIIVAVTRDDDWLLMVQSHNFKADYMGLVAGFVETGETLEECVRREVMEETGISITDITYFGSQAWPYPSGLMVGFKARYAGGDFVLQTSELRKGGWFHRDAMPAIPGKVSLARRLIDDFLENKP